MEAQAAPTPINANVLKMVMLDFTAILLGYNLPREEARQVAAKAVEPVREHFANSGAVLRRQRL
jgi:hypothetical protein